METKTADQTIERFELVLETCHQQGVPVSDQLQLRMLLARPNDRYLSLKKIYQHISTKPDLDSIFASMRDDDDDHQKSHASLATSTLILDRLTGRVCSTFSITSEGQLMKGYATNRGRAPNSRGSAMPAI